MNVLWITFAPLGKANRLFYNRMTQSGGWVDASVNALQPYIRSGQLLLHIACMGDRDVVLKDSETSVTYHLVNMQPCRGKRADHSHVQQWNRLIKQINPDLIQIWGTEFTFGLDVMEAARSIPVCYFIQGVMSSLAEHPFGDISAKRLAKQLGFSAWPKLWQQHHANQKNRMQVSFETQMIEKSAGILADNQWTQAQYQLSDEKVFFVPLPMNPIFGSSRWTAESCQRHTAFTVAGGGCPQKGIHTAVKAVALLKKKYPDMRLYIPGNISSRKPNLLYDSIYIRHLKKMILEYGLQENIVFLGALTPEQMAQQMQKANVFVMPSCVETHSSTLREAMHVGTPCVSAAVGSVPEFLKHGINGFLYRYGEANTLAYYIEKIFSDDTLAGSVGEAGRKSVKEAFFQDEAGAMLMEAYRKMITENEHENDETAD